MRRVICYLLALNVGEKDTRGYADILFFFLLMECGT